MTIGISTQVGAVAAGTANTGAAPHERADGQLPGWKTGAALGAVAAIASFQPSLMPRSAVQQGGVTAASAGLGFAAGIGANALANTIDDHTDLGAVGSRLALAGAGAAAYVATTLAMHGNPSVPLDTLRTAARVVTTGSLVGAALVGEDHLVDRVAGDNGAGRLAAHGAIFGAAALGVGAYFLKVPRASAVSAEADAAYRASLGVQGGGIAAEFDAGEHARVVALREQMTHISGIGPDTLLPERLIGKSGFRFLHEATPPSEISRVMGIDPSAVQEPVRVYGGLRHAGSREELATKIYDEAVRLGAFDRSQIMIYTPSGTGHVNPGPVATMEFLTGGDVASIGMQYANKPSLLSLNKVDEGADLFNRVLTKFASHIDAMPEGAARPKIAIYGESLGGWASQDVFLHTGAEGLAARGVDRAVWVGSPSISGFRRELLGTNGQGFDATKQALEFDSLDGLQALAPAEKAKVRAFFLTHHNDPVNKFSPTLFVEPPAWLRSAEHGQGVPRTMRWIPEVSGPQGVVDLMNGTHVKPGVFERSGHDYRADLAPVMAEVFDARPTAQQLTGIVDDLKRTELARALVPLVRPS